MRESLRLTILACAGLLATCVSTSTARGAENLCGKVAFLVKGDVWISDLDSISGLDSAAVRQLTQTGGKVEEFFFSPSLRFLAYSNVIEYVDDPGLYEEGEEVPQRSVCSIVILDLESNRVVEEIQPKEGWIYAAKWLSASRLLCYESSGFDVSGFFTYDALSRTREDVDVNRGSMLLDADFSLTDSLMAYVSDSGLGKTYSQHLHVADLKTGEDTVIASRRSVSDPTFSADHKAIAFLEVESDSGKYFDNLWVCGINGDRAEKLYRGPARPKSGGVDGLSWSPDSRRVAYFYPSEALVFDVGAEGAIQKIEGQEFSWTEGRTVLVSRAGDLYLVDLDTGTTKPFRKSAAAASFLP